MSQKVFDRIVSLLRENNISYKLFEHEPVFTSDEAANVRGTNPAAGAKALIFRADENFIMLVLPGNKRVDSKKFKKDFDIKDLRFASPEQVEEITNGVKIGAVHPIGSLHRLPVYVDPSLGENEKIVFNAGLHEKSIEIAYRDYIGLVKPKVANFAV